MDAKWRARLAPYTRFGARAALVALAKRVLQPVVELGSVVVIELPVVPHAPAAGVRLLTPAELPAVTALFGRPPGELEARVARGDRGFAAWEGERLLHMRWVTIAATAIPECGLWLRPGPGQVYVYDIVTAPAARGRSLVAAVRDHVDHVLAGEGVTGKLGYVRADNHSMWRTLRSAGQVRRLMRIGYVVPRGRAPIVIGGYGPPVYASP